MSNADLNQDQISLAESTENAISLETTDVPARQAVSERVLQAWIARVVEQDQAALGELYDHLVSQVYGLVIRVTRSASLAEEVVQDTFWQVWRQAPRFEPERGSVVSWIMTIARSRALDALRRVEIAETELDPEMAEAIPTSPSDSPFDLMEAIQEGSRLYLALAELETVPRQLLALAFFRGLSHEEIAVSSGLPLGTVKSHIRRALTQLKSTLASQPQADLRS